MEISFRVEGNIQVVSISGAMGDPEAAAVRVKLEQKINQGRNRVLFDIPDFDLGKDASRRLLLGIVSYTINRGALVCVCGVQAANYPLFLLPTGKQPKLFFTFNEGVDYLNKSAMPSQKPQSNAPRTEDELKSEALESLLAKYSVFQQTDEDDPFRLQFVSDQYKERPNREALVIEKRAWDAFKVLQDEIKIADNQCDRLAAQVKTFMLYRKIPLSAKELELKQGTLNREIQDVKATVAKIKTQVEGCKSSVLAHKQKAMDTRASLDQSIKEYETKIATAEKTYHQEIESLKTQDAQEQKDFEVKMK